GSKFRESEGQIWGLLGSRGGKIRDDLVPGADLGYSEAWRGTNLGYFGYQRGNFGAHKDNFGNHWQLQRQLRGLAHGEGEQDANFGSLRGCPPPRPPTPPPPNPSPSAAPWGRRGWKPFQTVLKGTLLYFLKAGPPRRGSEPPGTPPAEAEEPLGVHHALAERASKYTKRPHVFRLQTADQRVLLFQAPSEEEMSSWISRINLAAALLSSPPFPAAVGSQRRFARPILPAAPSRSPPEEQHRAHEEWMERVAQELFEHQRNLPEKRGRARDLDEYRVKKEYLLYERRRYETYVQVLETWINSGAQDLEGWEAQAGAVAAPPEPPNLTKAHSSPSLAPESTPPAGVRVKRNISERRTVRKVIPKRNKNLL
uniref:PH domain-containing protein n=1 Tax=Anas platyrhynchos platyrhynchos TaxID=8840 RepID=A0A493TNS5_ANAPP